MGSPNGQKSADSIKIIYNTLKFKEFSVNNYDVEKKPLFNQTGSLKDPFT